MTVQDIAALIAVRNFAYQAVDNIFIKMSREEVRAIQTRVAQLDKKIVEGVIALDLTAKEPAKNEFLETPSKFVNANKARVKPAASEAK